MKGKQGQTLSGHHRISEAAELPSLLVDSRRRGCRCSAARETVKLAAVDWAAKSGESLETLSVPALAERLAVERMRGLPC